MIMILFAHMMTKCFDPFYKLKKTPPKQQQPHNPLLNKLSL